MGIIINSNCRRSRAGADLYWRSNVLTTAIVLIANGNCCVNNAYRQEDFLRKVMVNWAFRVWGLYWPKGQFLPALKDNSQFARHKAVSHARDQRRL
jgi:hypothetical protein